MKASKPHHSSDVWLALASVYVIWGSTYLAIHFAIQTIPPFLMAGARFFTSGLLLLGAVALYGLATKREFPRIPWAHWKSSMVAGFFLLLIGNGGVCWAEQKVPSGMTALLIGTVPIWMVLLEWTWYKGLRPGVRTLAGVALGFTGIAVLVLAKPDAGSSLKFDPLWALLLAGTSLAWAWGSLYVRSAPLPSNAILATALEMITGGLQLLAFGLLLGEQNQFQFSYLTASSTEAWIYLTLVGSLVGFTAYIWVLQKATPALASTYAFVNPVIAVFLGWFLAGEALSPALFLAAFLIVGAVVLITLSAQKRKRN